MGTQTTLAPRKIQEMTDEVNNKMFHVFVNKAYGGNKKAIAYSIEKLDIIEKKLKEARAELVNIKNNLPFTLPE